MTDICCPEIFGADPVNITWNVVRGDTSSLDIQFLEDDEITAIDISDWTFVATAFNKATQSSDELEITESNLGITITATSEITETWGSGIQSRSAELLFDLQGTNSDQVVWTPVIGIISVLGDVTTP